MRELLLPLSNAFQQERNAMLRLVVNDSRHVSPDWWVQWTDKTAMTDRNGIRRRMQNVSPTEQTMREVGDCGFSCDTNQFLVG